MTLLLLAAALLAGAPVRGEGRVEERAFALYREGDYAGAAALLRRMAEQPGARPEVHRALASCYLKLKDDERAAAALRAYLAVAPPGAERDQASARLAEVDERLTTAPASITSEPPAAAVFLDGGERSAGTTPLSLRLAVGSRRVRLSLAGHQDLETVVDVKRGVEAVVAVRLSAAPQPIVPSPPAPSAALPAPAAAAPPAPPSPEAAPVGPSPPPAAVAPPVAADAPAAPIVPIAATAYGAGVARNRLRVGAIAAASVALIAGATGLGLYYGGAVPAANEAGSPTATPQVWLAGSDETGHYSGPYWVASVAAFAVAGAAAVTGIGLLIAERVAGAGDGGAPRVSSSRGGVEVRF